MLSQQESWVFPVSHSSQFLCSDPTVKSFFLREGEGTGAQLPLLALLNSLECQGIFWPYQHTSAKTSTVPQPWIYHRPQNPSPVLQHIPELEFYILPAFIQHCCGDKAKDFPQKSSQIPPQASAQWEISNPGRKSPNFHFGATRTRWRHKNHPGPPWNHPQLGTGSKGKCWEEFSPQEYSPAPPKAPIQWIQLVKRP